MVRLLVLALAGVGGCADPCVDDGWGQAECPDSGGAAGETESAGATETWVPTTGSTMSASTSASASMSGTASGPSTGSGSTSASETMEVSASNTETSTETSADTMGGTTEYCDDADGDGFGDPDACQDVPNGRDPPPGTVDNDDDCDDTLDTAFPGAAPNDSPTECMEDKDGDDWGDDDPSAPTTSAGSDCDDTSAETFPGAAEEESPTACMKDEDEDGWGDDDPPAGVDAGADCDEDGEPPCALVVTQDGTFGSGYDSELQDSLDALGFDITVVADTDAELDDANGFTVVVISESSHSTDIAGTFEDVAVPVVCLEGLIWDDMSMADEGTDVSGDELDILDDMSALAGGLSGTVDVVGGGASGLFWTTPPMGALEIASVSGNATEIAYFAFDAGDPMLNAFAAPRRRVGLGYDADQGGGSASLTTVGQALFEAAVTWAIQ